MFLREFHENGTIPPEGKTPDEILKNEEVVSVCNKSAEIAKWRQQFSRPRMLIDQNTGEEVGKAIILERTTSAATDITIDLTRESIWVTSTDDNPRQLSVRSLNIPSNVSLDDPTWRKELASSVIEGCSKPGKFADYELGGRHWHII